MKFYCLIVIYLFILCCHCQNSNELLTKDIVKAENTTIATTATTNTTNSLSANITTTITSPTPVASSCVCSDESLCKISRLNENTKPYLFWIINTEINQLKKTLSKDINILSIHKDYLTKEAVCYAKSLGIKVLVWFPVSGATRDYVVTEEGRASFLRIGMEKVNKFNLNGIDIDIETDLDSPYYEYLLEKFRELLPVAKGYTVLTDLPTNYNFVYDVKRKDRILNAVDYVAMMNYDQSYGLPYLGANSNHSQTLIGQETFLKAGFPANRLITGLPLYAYYGKCVTKDLYVEQCVLSRPRLNTAYSLAYINSIVSNNRTDVKLTSGLLWDQVSLAPYINYMVTTNLGYDIYQTRYDNALSLRLKIQNSKAKGGVAFFRLDNLYGMPEARINEIFEATNPNNLPK
ncbi:hypothetical protein CYY_004099 [Polysphondylium violaceum]|uniref:GH18 domain-containing protein n=1 Tax=Polysphondylium violaceum TaxID=133409 RepID=A0A8J4PXL3_9MYCE|nr:hypothetical protein CYY_004099 [Polysphondylium violaceum]